jgi:hypothetical protein
MFEPEEVIKDKSELKDAHEHFRMYYKIIVSMYKHMQIGSKSYPQINIKDLNKFFFNI